MRYPKLRELKEAVIAVFSPRFTTRFPAEPCVVPEKYRGKPEFDLDTCIGCGACVSVCPSSVCLTQEDDVDADPPVRRITLNYYTCIFCGNCSDNCTTEKGINLSNEWDLAGLDREAMTETHEFELPTRVIPAEAKRQHVERRIQPNHEEDKQTRCHQSPGKYLLILQPAPTCQHSGAAFYRLS